MRRIAAKYPDVTFLVGTGGAQETTLRDAQPNLFRLTPDGAQSVAGLGDVRLRELGWRRAVVVAEGYAGGWELTAGFVAEFCSLGGTIVERDFESLLFTPNPAAAAARHAESADGVALLATAGNPDPVPRRLRGRSRSGARLAARRLRPTVLRSVEPRPGNVDLTGVVLGGTVPLDPDDRSMRAYRESLERAYPTLPAGRGVSRPDVCLVQRGGGARVRARGDGRGARRGPGERCGAPWRVSSSSSRRARCDSIANRQAIAEIALERIVRRRSGKAELEGIATVEGVDQSFGGLFTADDAAAVTRDARVREGLTARLGRASQPAIVQVYRVSAPRGASPPGRTPRRTRIVGPSRGSRSPSCVGPSPSRCQRSGRPRQTTAVPAAASTSAAGSGATSRGSAVTPSARCTASDALASSRLASRPASPTVAPARRSCAS